MLWYGPNGYQPLRAKLKRLRKMSKSEKKGFVFLSNGGRPYWCAYQNGEYWLHYWHKSEGWVILQKMTLHEVYEMPRNLSERDQEKYHIEHRKRT